MYSQTVANMGSVPAVVGSAAFNPRSAARCDAQIIVVDMQGRLIEATAGGHALISEGHVFSYSFNRLRGATRTAGAQFDRAFSSALQTGHAKTVFEQGEQRHEIELFTVHDGDNDEMRLIILVKAERDTPHRALRSAQTAFGLTRAESRLLEALFAGCSVPRAADLLGVARSTARTHLQRIFDKTGVRRQGDLMRIVASG